MAWKTLTKLRASGNEPLATDELWRQIERKLSPEIYERLGPIGDLLSLVLLELETRGDVARMPDDDESDVGPTYGWTGGSRDDQ